MLILKRIWNAFVYGVFNIIHLVVFPFAAIDYIITGKSTIWDECSKIQKEYYFQYD